MSILNGQAAGGAVCGSTPSHLTGGRAAGDVAQQHRVIGDLCRIQNGSAGYAVPLGGSDGELGTLVVFREGVPADRVDPVDDIDDLQVRRGGNCDGDTQSGSAFEAVLVAEEALSTPGMDHMAV